MTPKVIIRRCREYDVAAIRAIAREGLEELGLRPHGRMLLKPNCVISGDRFEHAYTRAEFLEGVLCALKDRASENLEELAVGERCGITLPTRRAFSGAGYYEVFKRVGAQHYCFEETTQFEVPLRHAERLRDAIFIPGPVARADFFVNCPKFKAHPWTTVTFSMKNYIGLQDDRHRLIDHDHKLDEKVADLQYVIQPQFICIDAITAGEGRMLTPVPYDMGLIIMGNNQVAFDAVCSRIIGVDPASVSHIRLAHERRFGPLDVSQIEITGDVPFEQACEQNKGFRVGLIRVEKYFEGSKIKAYAGPPPGDEKDYCWGGCPGAIEEAIEILREYDARGIDEMPVTHVVFGAYKGPIEAQPGEKVIFIGDCAEWKGELQGKLVQIQSLYKDRSTIDPREAKHDDVFKKMVSTTSTWRKHKDEGVVRIQGCPVSVAEQTLILVNAGNLKNPILDPSEAGPFAKSYLAWKSAAAFRKAFGKRYQSTKPIERGDARPKQDRDLE